MAEIPMRRRRASIHNIGLTFAEKVDRGSQSGVIPADETGTFRLINKIRNRFAHEPRSYFSQNTSDEIWKGLSPRMIDRFANPQTGNNQRIIIRLLSH